MSSVDRSTLRAIETLLAAAVLAVAVVVFTDLPEPWPAWPTVGPVPVDPELVVPGLLGLAAVAGALADGLGVGPVVSGALGALTAVLALLSGHTLVVAEGGVFFGGLFTLAAGVALAVVVLVRAAARRVDRRDPLRHAGGRPGE